jgi:hypothetical protein
VEDYLLPHHTNAYKSVGLWKYFMAYFTEAGTQHNQQHPVMPLSANVQLELLRAGLTAFSGDS